jgi:hypothetical protein
VTLGVAAGGYAILYDELGSSYNARIGTVAAHILTFLNAVPAAWRNETFEYKVANDI